MRRILWMVAVLALVAAACGGDGDDGGDGEALACGVGETDGDLVLYNWTEYIDPTLIDDFEAEYGVAVIEDFFPNNEELFAKVDAGAAGYDVAVPSDYMVSIMADEGLLMELDKDAIPNIENLAPEFTSVPYDEGNVYSVPYQWGTTGIAVDLEVVGEDFDESWALIFDPAAAGIEPVPTSVLNDTREVLGAALRYLGYSLNTTDQAELDEASQLLANATDTITVFDSDQYEDLLIEGTTAIAHGYSGDFFAAFDGASTDEFDAYERYYYFVPEEGGVRWVDNMVVLADAPSPCTAHTFINFMLEPENGATLTNWNYYGSPNAAAEEFILPEILEDPSIYPTEETLANLEFLADTGDFEVQYEDAFTRARG